MLSSSTACCRSSTVSPSSAGFARRAIHTPVLILSALGDVDEKVKGLRAGGDDYLGKPYSFAELLARVEGLARRNTSEPQQTRLSVSTSK